MPGSEQVERETPAGNADGKRAINRQSKSCRVCRLRKVKCDRVKPCHACCSHGYPSKCVYDSQASDEEAQPISQGEEINNLRKQLKNLRAQVSRQGNKHGTKRLADLERLFDAIRSAPIDRVEDIVRNVRVGQSRLARQLTPPSQGFDERDEDDYDYDDDDSDDSTGLALTRTLPFGRSRRNDAASSFYGSLGDFDEEDDTDFNSSSGPSSSPSSDESSSTLSRFASNKPSLDVFVERFVDAFSPEVDSSSGKAGAIRAACNIRMFSPLITNAFEAVSVTFFGKSVQDPRIESAGLKLYPQTLRTLQSALLDPEMSKAEATLITVTLLLAFESIERTSEEGVVAHVKGALRLIQHRGPDSHTEGVEHLLFTELRPYWVFAALADRQPTFLELEEWKTIPWSKGTTEKNLLHYLLDLVVEIPKWLDLGDELDEATRQPDLGKTELRVKQARLWNGIDDLTARMKQWWTDWVDCYPAGPPTEREGREDDDPFPIFRRRDLRTGKLFEPPGLEYPDLLLCQTVCVYAATRLVLTTADSRPSGAVSKPEKYELACDITRSMAWYVRNAPGNMINRLAFPVRIAWVAFPANGPERDFLREVFLLVERRHSLRLWGSQMPELSARIRTPQESPA